MKKQDWRELCDTGECDGAEGTGQQGDLWAYLHIVAIKNVTPKRHILNSVLFKSSLVIVLSTNQHE